MPTSYGLKWGIILGLSTSLATQILTWLGLGLTQWFVVATFLLVIAVTVLGIKNVAASNGQFPTIVQILYFLVIMILVSRLIFQIYMFFYTRYVEPDWVENVTVIWTEMMTEQGNTSNQISQQIAAFKKSYETVPMFTVELVKYAIPQLILALIPSFILWFLNNKKLKKMKSAG